VVDSVAVLAYTIMPDGSRKYEKIYNTETGETSIGGEVVTVAKPEFDPALLEGPESTATPTTSPASGWVSFPVAAGAAGLLTIAVIWTLRSRRAA
jgi:hypothetical protein